MYDSDGKKIVRDLAVEVARRSGCETFLDFWGGGASARQATAAGLRVTSAEKDKALQAGLVEDAREHGYVAHLGDATEIEGTFDFVFADFCGNANPSRFAELRKLTDKTGEWIAVTLAPDWQMDESLQGEAATFTVPAWLVGATQMSLEYIARYVRNDQGTRMWFAILRRQNHSAGLTSPAEISRNLLSSRGYWSRRPSRKSVFRVVNAQRYS